MPQTTPEVDSSTAPTGENDPAAPAAYQPVGAAAFSSPSDATRYWSQHRAKPLPLPRLPSPTGGKPPVPEGPQGGTGGASPPGVRAAPRSRLAPAGGVAGAAPQAGLSFQRGEWTGSNLLLPARSEAKLRFVDPSTNKAYECSGTVISTANKSVVWTAGHCVFNNDESGRVYMTRMAVAPGYKEGRAPFGWWPARLLVTTNGWIQGGQRYDLGAVVVDRQGGRTIVDTVGAQGIHWNVRGRPRILDFGYPAAPPFDGEHLTACLARVGGSDNPRPALGGPPTRAMGCDMTEGSSGGGWITRFRPSRGWGYVYSVNSYGYDHEPVMFGPYQGKAAKNLYAAVASK